MQSHYHRLGAILWRVLVVVLVLLAVYVALGRLLVSSLGQYQSDILQELNLRVPFNISARSVEGRWQMFSPAIVLRDLRVSFPENPEAPLQLEQGRIGIDVWQSLATRSLRVTEIMIDGLSLRAEFSAEGQFRLRGFTTSRGESGDWLQEFILGADRITARDATLEMSLPSGERRSFALNLRLSRSGSDRRLEGVLTSTRGMRVDLVADGVGDPRILEDFDGDLYLNIDSPDTGAVKDMLGSSPPAVWMDGDIGVELWFALNRGEPLLETRVRGENLIVKERDNAWSIALQELGFEAQISEDDGSWTVTASDVTAKRSDVGINLPRAQLDIWGSSARLRTVDLDLQSLADFMQDIEALPERMRTLLLEMDPSGQIPAMQINVSNLERPADDWEFEASFRELALQSYRGAPGTTSAKGHMQLTGQGGKVLIDSKDMTLAFPGVFTAPLFFDSLSSALDISWNEEQVLLASNVIRAEAEIGALTGLFALDIPLQTRASGITMDLMIGLRDGNPAYRGSYLPVALDPGLLNFLDTSIGRGVVEEGAFLWRGSLRREAPELRTVQLAFNVAATDFSFSEDWPSVEVSTGIVLVDDADASVWIPAGTLKETQVTNLSVETSQDDRGRVVVDIEGTLKGPAADALYVVNNSPIAAAVGTTFDEWRASGVLQTRLNLELVLGDNAPQPVVDVATQWTDTEIYIDQADLSLSRVNGSAAYNSKRGFSSDNLSAYLWGNPVALSLKRVGDSANGVQVTARSDISSGDLQSWLGVDLLSMLQGRSDVTLSVHVGDGDSPYISAATDLKGMALDLPAPYGKPADTSREFSLRYPLGGAEPEPITLALGDEVALLLDLSGDALNYGAVAFGGAVPQRVPGQFTISGELPSVDLNDYTEFLRKYFVFEKADTTTRTAVTGNDASLSDEAAPLPVVVQRLSVGEAFILNRRYEDISVNADVAAGTIRGDVETPWLNGEFAWVPDSNDSFVNLAYLDIDGLQGVSEDEVESPETASSGVAAEQNPSADQPLDATPGALAGSVVSSELNEGDAVAADSAIFDFSTPPLRLRVDELRRGETLFGNLALLLEADERGVRASGIEGELLTLTFSSDRPATFEWLRGASPETRLQAAFTFEDFGDLFDRLGYEKIIETRSGDLALDMAWPGSPADFAMLRANGNVRVELGKGSFLTVSAGAAGALRVVNIVNLVYIVQSLSVTHMFDSGIPFQSVAGDIALQNGTIEVPRLHVKGGSSFIFSGTSDIASETLDGELIATLPVANNLPWVAALAASLPVAAGVFVVSKIFDKQVNRLSSAVYSIEGTWDEPDVNFSRIFDNSSRNREKSGSDGEVVPTAPGNEGVAVTEDENSAHGSSGNLSRKSAQDSAAD